MKCPNCGRTLGCSCMVKTAKDGTKCCTLCINAVNDRYRDSLRLQHKGETNIINKNRRNVLV